MNKCLHCGHEGDDVSLEWVRCGGTYDWLPYCNDRIECWARWQKQQINPAHVADEVRSVLTHDEYADYLNALENQTEI